MLSVGLCVLLLSGCARMPFSHGMREEYLLNPAQIRKLQFYTSGPITLERRVTRAIGETTEKNDLQLTQAEAVRVVRIPGNTPGVALFVTNDMLEISFEPGRSLFFGSSPAQREKVGDNYSLLARDWSGRRGTLTYGGQTYVTGKGNGAVHLLVDVVELRKTKVVDRTVKGMSVRDPAVDTDHNLLTGRTVKERSAGPPVESPSKEDGPRPPVTP
jgi:hypothetical protein